jgi:hypothetical protein
VREINPNLLPPGGYRFVDADNVTHVGASFKLLIEALTRYRRRIGRPPGDPHREVSEQICDRSPKSCVEVNVSYPVQNKALASAVVAEITRMKMSRVKFNATEKQIADRVIICKGCPANVEWEKYCPPCQDIARKILPALVKPNQPVARLRGRACLLARDDLSVAVRLSNPTAMPGCPPGCWRSDE